MASFQVIMVLAPHAFRDWSKKSTFLPAQPRHAKTCLSAGKAASREEGEAYRGRYVEPFEQ